MVSQATKKIKKKIKVNEPSKGLLFLKKMEAQKLSIEIKNRWQKYLEYIETYSQIKKSSFNLKKGSNKSFFTLKNKKEKTSSKIVESKNLNSELGFISFKKTKRNTCISICDSQSRVKSTLSIGHLRVNKAKLKVKARKAAYNLKKLSYILGSIIYKAGFRQLYLKFKNDIPKKEGQIYYNILKSNKKFKVVILSLGVARPHNGCRRRKLRRK